MKESWKERGQRHTELAIYSHHHIPANLQPVRAPPQSIHPSIHGPAPALNKDLMSPNHLSGRSDQGCNTQQQVPRMRSQPDTEVLKTTAEKAA